MNGKFNNLKREIMPFLILFILFDIVITGNIIIGAHDHADAVNMIEKTMAIFGDFMNNLTSFRFITAIGVDFNGFMNGTLWTFLAFVILFIAWKIKMKPDHEYDGVENGSSDWSKNGEEFNRLSNGSEVLNKKGGFILSRKHYLGTDLKKVAINKNILVVGRIGCW